MKHTTESIYELFCCKLKPFILSWVHSSELADDIQQDVFIKIHEKIETLKDDTKVKSWVLQITRNTILDYLRKQNEFSEEVHDSMLIEEPDIQELANDNRERNLEKEIYEGLVPLIESLPPKYSEAIRLVEFEGLSQMELAKKLNISPSGAKSRVQRGRKLIKDTLMNCCHYEFDKYGTVIGVHQMECCCCEENK
ncbi:MAG: RNA polymerase sigma factor SigZ [Salinivirgaceae bacterium]|jgi:RNA polymerase sigma-70 factor (ECF subfamily)|nr:RNA polymerase sigma factor SigZ [Salinivirgaceae bacterium]